LPQESEFQTAKASFDKAMTFLRAGDPEMSEKFCRRALNEFPRDANLLCLLGASLVKQNKAKEAEHTLSRAVRLYGTFARAHEGLAESLMLQGRLKEALESLERAAKLEPGSPSISLKRAKVLDSLGRAKEANVFYEESFELTPYRKDLSRGLNLQLMGDLREAEKIYRDVLTRDPKNVDALRLMSGIALHAKQFGDAEVLLERALEIAPDFYQCLLDLGQARVELDRTDDAMEAYYRAMRLKPELPIAYVGAGTAAAMAGRHAEATELFEKALQRAPKHLRALCGMGHVLKTVGRQDEAIEMYRKACAVSAGCGEAWWSLANLKTFRFEPAEVEAMEGVLADEKLGDEPRANIQFALGKAYEDLGDFDRAFGYYKAGNDNRRARETYDTVQTMDQHDKFIEVFSRELFDRFDGVGDPSPAPIFIVGLPRSGSTLIEQILASHPEVEGTHELPDLGRVARSVGVQSEGRKAYPQAVADLDAAQFAEFGAKYLTLSERHRELGRPYFTDKLPNNFVHVGFVSLILPNAKIIDARRHPLDSCLGSYKQLFARGQPFTYELFELGEFYREYMRVMEHWDTVLPGKVLKVQYEDTVADLETQVRRILDYCGLPWDDACLKFYETERAVKTASSEQVRSPIYTGAMHRWRKYEAHLEPLIESLEPVLSELPDDWQPEAMRRGSVG